MKNINKYILILAVFVFGSCDPLEDEIDTIKKELAAPSRDLEYTLTDDDYDTADEVCECAGFGSFSSDDDVKAGVPAVLTDVFPALGNGSSAIVTYKFFNGSSPDYRDQEIVTLTAQEYLDLGFDDGYFSNIDEDVVEYINWKFPNAADHDYADVTFDYEDENDMVVTATSRVVYTVAYGWHYVWILPDAAYGDFFDESGTDFSNSDEGKEKMPVYLNEFFSLFRDEGETMAVQFNYDDRDFSNFPIITGEPNVPDVGLYIFSGGEWLLYNDHFQIVDQSLAFGHDGTTWIPDNTIKYTFTAADFAVAADDANGLGNQAARDNLAQFGNFGTQWSDAEISEAIIFVLNLNFGDQAIGQKYLVTYNTFPAGDLQKKFIKEADTYVEIPI